MDREYIQPKYGRAELTGDLFVIVHSNDWKWIKEEEEDDDLMTYNLLMNAKWP